MCVCVCVYKFTFTLVSVRTFAHTCLCVRYVTEFQLLHESLGVRVFRSDRV